MTTLIERFLSNSMKLTRMKSGEYVKGEFFPGREETLTINGSLQPLNARELKQVSEGYRLRQLFKLYSDQPVLTINTKTLGDTDRITIDGDSYKVLSVEQWKGPGFDLPYFKSVLAREPEQ